MLQGTRCYKVFNVLKVLTNITKYKVPNVTNFLILQNSKCYKVLNVKKLFMLKVLNVKNY